MYKHILFALALLVGAGMFVGSERDAIAGPPGYCGYTNADAWMYYHAHQAPWHGQYRHTAYGKPVSLIVPPIANLQTEYRWGVPSSRVRPIHHQFGRSYPAEAGAPGTAFRPTPYWPSSTDQFGVYYMRGPW